MSLADLIDPMEDRIAVQVRTADEITKSGLYLPAETNRSLEGKAVQGVVVAFGDPDDAIPDYVCDTCGDAFAEKHDFELHKSKNHGHDLCHEVYPRKFTIGDTVIFGKYSGTELKYQPPVEDEDEKNTIERKPRPAPEKIIILSYKDILARIKRPEEAHRIQIKG